MDRGTLVVAARTTPDNRLADFATAIDLPRLRRYRLDRVRAAMKEANCSVCVLFDPFNIRYAAGSRYGQIFQMHVPLRYLFIAAEGPVVLFGREKDGLDTVDEYRPALPVAYMVTGSLADASVDKWAAEIADLVALHGNGERRLAIDRADARIFNALVGRQIACSDAQAIFEQARAIKSPEEILCMNYAIAAAEVGMARMREVLRPGMTENEAWSHLWQATMAMGSEWIEGRLLAAGDRTNPWFQESSDRVIRPGELLAFDTDMIGPFGYCADISRTFRAGPGKPTPVQRELYQLAYEQLVHNLRLLKPGLTFRDWSEQAWPMPPAYVANRYVCLAHGVGLCDEWPTVYSREDWATRGYDGVVEPGMVLCVESYIGAEGGREGVKLEEQVLVTETGTEVLSKFPFEEDFLA
jgi:Xaa-Pro aminopeptidase